MTEEREETNPDTRTEPSETAARGQDPESADSTREAEGGAGTEPRTDGEGPDESPGDVLPLVEALLFAAPKPVPIEKLAEAAELPEATVARAVEALEAACAADGRGVRLDRVAGGVRLVTRPEYDYPVRRLLGLDGKTKLSMAALETLAIVAYRQPVTAPEIAELRGVNSSSSIRTLLDRKLITTAGRKEVVGTPFLYKTTKEFLVHFGLKGLGDLPKPEELEAIYGLESPKPDPAQTELFHVDEATGEVDEEGPGEEPPETPRAAPEGGAAEGPQPARSEERALADGAPLEEERHDD